MSKEKLEQALLNWQEQLAEYELELSITSSSPQRFELRKRIQQCEEEIKRIEAKIKALEKGNESSIAQLQTQPAPPSPAVAPQPEPTSGSENQAIEVFFSYAHEDEELRDELAKHLKLLERQKMIAAWYDREIGAGTEWKHSIEQRLNSAQVILLLISADFLASDFCWGVELRRAMERHEAGEARVIPVILRPVDWRGAQFGQLQALPKNALPITTWSNQDEAFLDVARRIRQVVEELKQLAKQDISVSPGSGSKSEEKILSRRFEAAMPKKSKVGQKTEVWVQSQPAPPQPEPVTTPSGVRSLTPAPPSEVTPSRKPEPETEVELKSERGVDYTKLRDLLAAGEWKEADSETRRLLLKIAKRERDGWLNGDSIHDFPCIDLLTIDRLWVRYSNGRFGLSVQKRIYEAEEENYPRFSERIGWKIKNKPKWLDYEQLIWTLEEAPIGQLPRYPNLDRSGAEIGNPLMVYETTKSCKALANHLKKCEEQCQSNAS